jgi:hypothetical protein
MGVSAFGRGLARASVVLENVFVAGARNRSDAWRGAAFVRAAPPRKVHPSTSAASNGVKQAAPGDDSRFAR